MLLCLTTAASYAQVNAKPKVFAAMANRIELSETTLKDAFEHNAGDMVQLNFGPGFIFNGQITRKEDKYNNLTQIVVKSNAYNGAMFQLSRIIDEDNNVSYVGRIISEKIGDGYEIRRERGNYSFNKFDTDKVLQDCSQQ
jgi:hypothetical protein